MIWESGTNKANVATDTLLPSNEKITKYCTKHEEQVEVRRIRSNHDGVDRTIWIVDILDPSEQQ